MQTLEITTGTGRHFYQFYKGREDLFRITLPFLFEGLLHGDACLWLVSRSIGVLKAIEAFQRQYDILRYIENGQLLVFPAERWYLVNGRFSERKALHRLHRFTEERKKRGFTSFRGAGDGAWFDLRDWGKIQAYERKIHDWVLAHRVLAVCAYPIEDCTVVQTRDVLEHHHSPFLTKL